MLAQTHVTIELIIIDDASSDQTINIINNISDSRIRLIKRSTCSGGPATPRNQGIETAKGQYLAFIDSDDVWHREKLERQLVAIEQHQLNFVSSSLISFKGNTPKPPFLHNDTHSVDYKDHETLLRKNWVITSSALIERNLFEEVRFNQGQIYIGIEDYLAWLQIHQRDDIKSGVLNAPLVLYRLRADSLSHSKYQMAKKILHLLKHYRYKGKPLGISTFYYFASYAVTSITAKFFKKSNL